MRGAVRPSKQLVTLTILSGFLPWLTSASVEGGQNKGETVRRGGEASARMSAKRAANTNAQWSADPEKGWVRADERHKLQDKRQSKDKVKKSGKHKGQGQKALPVKDL